MTILSAPISRLPMQAIATVWTSAPQDTANLHYDFSRFQSCSLGQAIHNEVAAANLAVTAPFQATEAKGQQALVATPTLPANVTPIQEAGLGSWAIGGALILVGLWALNDQLNPVHINAHTMNRFVARRLVKKAHGKLPKVGQFHRFHYDEKATRQLMALRPFEMEQLIALLKPAHYGLLREVLLRELKASRDVPLQHAHIASLLLPLMKVLDEDAAWNITTKVLLEIERERPAPYCNGPKYLIATQFKEFVRLAPEEKQTLMAEKLQSDIRSLRDGNPSEVQLAHAERLEMAYQGLEVKTS